MRKTVIYIVFPLLFLLIEQPARAAHIVGGDMYYECLGNNNYRITLKIYRDCYSFGPTVAGFDAPAYIGIYDGSGNLLEVEETYLTFGPTGIPPDTRDPCLQAPSTVCVEEGVYEFIKYLPPRSGGYDIVYVRCCRNATIQNIVSPNATGATYITHIPDPGIASCNSSPRFAAFPPIVICANAPITFDHRAIDPDGDSLVYSLCTPYNGSDSTNPQPYPEPFLNTFNDINWLSPFYAGYPIAALPPLSINARTGLLTGTPNRLGQYVVGVCVEEYRNGTLIGETKRDFQFNVVQCLTDVRAEIPVVDTAGAAASGTSGVFIYQCQSLTVQFVNNTINGTYYHWDFGDPTTSADTSSLFEPAYTYPDTGNYIVTLIVNAGYNCADTARVLIKTYPLFTVDYDFTAGCANVPVNFVDGSFSTYGFINSWAWDFGDGTVSVDQNPNHLFLQGGNYAVTLYATNDKGCSGSKTKTVAVRPMPRAGLTYTSTCINTPVTFTDLSAISSGSIASRKWMFDNNVMSLLPSFTHTFDQLITFRLTLIAISDFGCADTVSEVITVHPLPVAVVRSDTALCIGESVTLHAAGGVIYQWQPSTGLNSASVSDPVATPAATTRYTVTVTDSNLCTDTGSVNIIVSPLPETDAGEDTYICEGSIYQLNGSGGIRFIWSPGDLVSDSTLQNPTISPSDTTTFVLTSFNVFGCRNADSVTIAVQHPINLVMESQRDMCEGDSITLSASGGLYYTWSPPGGLPDNRHSDYIVSPASSAVYTVEVSNDCFSTAGTVTVTVYPLPLVDAGADTNIIRDEFIVLNGTATGITHSWFPPNGLDAPSSLSTRASPFNTTTYVLTTESEYGCRASDDMTIYVTVINLIEIPTAFSPNNDGTNDLFRILKTLNIEQLYFFKIFNRWGQCVFETNDLKRGWDGTVYGVPQDVGVYGFIIKALNRDGEVVTREGTVTLLR